MTSHLFYVVPVVGQSGVTCKFLLFLSTKTGWPENVRRKSPEFPKPSADHPPRPLVQDEEHVPPEHHPHRSERHESGVE